MTQKAPFLPTLVQERKCVCVQMTSRLEAREAEAAVNGQWRALANVIDRLLFWITLLMLIVGILGMLIKSTQQPSQPSHVHLD